ncbi:MAG: hypothetical protein KJ858_00490, partial [Nanoarchaeota archaeon]|nr:hypothetical protein [Nanoarchaeota archaeon]
QISYQGKGAKIVTTDSGVFVVEKEKIRKISKDKLVDSDKKEFEEALKNTKERLTFNIPSKALEVLKKELGEFVVSF